MYSTTFAVLLFLSRQQVSSNMCYFSCQPPQDHSLDELPRMYVQYSRLMISTEEQLRPNRKKIQLVGWLRNSTPPGLFGVRYTEITGRTAPA